jgi:hypothetical protein
MNMVSAGESEDSCALKYGYNSEKKKSVTYCKSEKSSSATPCGSSAKDFPKTKDFRIEVDWSQGFDESWFNKTYQRSLLMM